MKKLISVLAFGVLLLLFNSKDSCGQGHLRIIRIDSFPQSPADTAFEGQVYHHIEVLITNTGTSNFSGHIDVFLQSQAVGVTDTLADPGGPPSLIGAGDTISIHADPFYRFRSTIYAAGDNIIVVWPYSVATPFDIYNTDIYFVPLSSVGINEPYQPEIVIYKNPVTEILQLNYADQNSVEQVRIYDIMGRELLRVDEAVVSIDISSFKSGIYLLEMVQKDGTHSVKKILIGGN